jgi:hypothetical protein
VQQQKTQQERGRDERTHTILLSSMCCNSMCVCARVVCHACSHMTEAGRPRPLHTNLDASSKAGTQGAVSFKAVTLTMGTKMTACAMTNGSSAKMVAARQEGRGAQSGTCIVPQADPQVGTEVHTARHGLCCSVAAAVQQFRT